MTDTTFRARRWPLRQIRRLHLPARSRPVAAHRPPKPAVRTGQGKVLTGLGRASVTAVTGLVIVTAAASFTESYRALYEWASHHGVAGFWAAIWPLQIDTFIAVGELALVAALVYGWSRKVRASWWAITLAGLAVSVAGNIGHVGAGDLATRVTAAVPPVAAAVALAAGLGLLKRLAERQATIAAITRTATAPATSAATLIHGTGASQPATPQPASQPSGSQPVAAPASHEVTAEPAIAEPASQPAARPARVPRPRVAAAGPSMEAEAIAARKAYRKSVRDGAPLSDRALGKKYEQTRDWGAKRISEVKLEPSLADASAQT